MAGIGPKVVQSLACITQKTVSLQSKIDKNEKEYHNISNDAHDNHGLCDPAGT